MRHDDDNKPADLSDFAEIPAQSSDDDSYADRLGDGGYGADSYGASYGGYGDDSHSAFSGSYGDQPYGTSQPSDAAAHGGSGTEHIGRSVSSGNLDSENVRKNSGPRHGAHGKNAANDGKLPPLPGDNPDGYDVAVTDAASEQEIAKKRKKRADRRFLIAIIAMVLLLIVGVGLILYPSIADAWNRHVSSKAVATYVEKVEDMSTEERDSQINAANEYNAALVGRGTSRFIPTEAEHEQYESILDVTGTGIMGYVTIPRISVRVPIYHGTSDTVLQIAAGHLEGSSFPVGGESTHAAISGHTGLPSALLFTGLDQLEKGDTFSITVFDEVLTYEVSEINVVEPTDVSDLDIVEGEDLVSLITCTPYGVNSHRLIVTGHRIPTPTSEEAGTMTDQALVKDIAFVVAAVVCVIIAVVAVILRRRYLARQARGVPSKKGVHHSSR